MGPGLTVPSAATILLLESEPVIRSAMRDALESVGYLVVPASDLAEALDRLAQTIPDLLIIPPYINSMPGRIAVDYLRRRENGLPVLLVAGLIEDDRVNTQDSIEEFHVFPKPFRREELIAQVKDVLDALRRKPG